LSNLYELTSTNEGFQFTNIYGDFYTVYITVYFLKNPKDNDEDEYINTYMFGFNCKRTVKAYPNRFDEKTKRTILSVFKKFVSDYPNDAFVYLCDDKDGMARNRRITFGSWFNETNMDHERQQSHVKYNGSTWYSCIIVKSATFDRCLQFYFKRNIVRHSSILAYIHLQHLLQN